MKFIPLTQGKFAIVDDEDFEFLMQWKWCVNNGYAVRSESLGTTNGKRKQKRIFMHRVIAKTPDTMQTDHISGDRLDNRRNNLRYCTGSQNLMNKNSNTGSSSKYKGVSWSVIEGKWKVAITVNGKGIHLGYYIREEDAAQVYNFAALEHFGEYARLNRAA